MLKRLLLLLILIFIFFDATLFATGESGWIYVLNRNYNEISVIEPGEKRLIYGGKGNKGSCFYNLSFISIIPTVSITVRPKHE